MYFSKVYFPKVYFPKFSKSVFGEGVFSEHIFSENVFYERVLLVWKCASILGPDFFDPKVTQPKLSQSERTWLAHLLSFCELVQCVYTEVN